MVAPDSTGATKLTQLTRRRVWMKTHPQALSAFPDDPRAGPEDSEKLLSWTLSYKLSRFGSFKLNETE